MVGVEDLQRPLLSRHGNDPDQHHIYVADSSTFKSTPLDGHGDDRNGSRNEHRRAYENGNVHGNGLKPANINDHEIVLDIPLEADVRDGTESKATIIGSTVHDRGSTTEDHVREEEEEARGEAQARSYKDTDSNSGLMNNDDDDGLSNNANLFSFLGDMPSLRLVPTIDPFRNHTESISNAYEWVKTILCLPLAILRLLLIVIITVIAFLYAKVVLLGWTDMHNPIPKWRRRLLYIPRLMARTFLFFLGYHWISRRGKQAKREVAPIIVSNHISFVDPIFFFYELFPSFVSSASHSDLPGIGMIIRPMQVINVDRTSPESKKTALKEIKNRAMNNDYPHVMLFPEATTTNGRALIFFQLGAFIPGLPVQPVVLRYPYVHFDNSWGRISILKIMFRMFTQFHNFIEVEYLPVVYPTPLEKVNPSLFAKKVKNVMAKALNVAETEHSYSDLILCEKAKQHKIVSVAPYLVEMAWMERTFGITTREAISFLEKFQTMDSDNRGCVSKEEYLEALGLPKTILSEQIFGFFDREMQGSISFREFLEGSGFISKHPSFERLCRTAFESCDSHKQGHLSRVEVEKTLHSVFPEISPLQVQRMHKKLDLDEDGLVNWDDFRDFLGRNPELLAVFLPRGKVLGIGVSH